MLSGQPCGILEEEKNYLDTVHSKSMPLCRESTKQLADPNRDRECLAMSAPFISFNIARALLLTSCLKVLHSKHRNHTKLSDMLVLRSIQDEGGHGESS